MPRLWNDTIEAHRRAVRDATLDTAAELVAKHGLRAVTMSQIAEQTGVGRATLYKYFRNVEEILFAWHERRVAAHLAELTHLRHGSGTALERLEATLYAYAQIQRDHSDHVLAHLLHRAEHGDRRQHVERAQHHLKQLLRDMLTEAARQGDARDDIAGDELALFCIAAANAASTLPSKAAVRRLVSLIVAGVRSLP